MSTPEKQSFERRVADVFGALDSIAPKQEDSSLRHTINDSPRECLSRELTSSLSKLMLCGSILSSVFNSITIIHYLCNQQLRRMDRNAKTIAPSLKHIPIHRDAGHRPVAMHHRR